MMHESPMKKSAASWEPLCCKFGSHERIMGKDVINCQVSYRAKALFSRARNSFSERCGSIPKNGLP